VMLATQEEECSAKLEDAEGQQEVLQQEEASLTQDQVTVQDKVNGENSGLEADDGEEEVDEELLKLLAPQVPAQGDFVLTYNQSDRPLEVAWRNNMKDSVDHGDGFLPVRSLQLSIKTLLADDKILLIANVPMASTKQHTGLSWTFKRGVAGKCTCIGPQFKSWVSSLCLMENVLMPWLDAPGGGHRARLDVEYSVMVRVKDSVHVSKDQERRQLCAVAIPATQITSSCSAEEQMVEPGNWYNVQGLGQVANPNEGEKVLVVCTINYKALWNSEYGRGRFTWTQRAMAFSLYARSMPVVKGPRRQHAP